MFRLMCDIKFNSSWFYFLSSIFCFHEKKVNNRKLLFDPSFSFLIANKFCWQTLFFLKFRICVIWIPDGKYLKKSRKRDREQRVDGCDASAFLRGLSFFRQHGGLSWSTGHDSQSLWKKLQTFSQRIRFFPVTLQLTRLPISLVENLCRATDFRYLTLKGLCVCISSYRSLQREREGEQHRGRQEKEKKRELKQTRSEFCEYMSVCAKCRGIGWKTSAPLKRQV